MKTDCAVHLLLSSIDLSVATDSGLKRHMISLVSLTFYLMLPKSLDTRIPLSFEIFFSFVVILADQIICQEFCSESAQLIQICSSEIVLSS